MQIIESSAFAISKGTTNYLKIDLIKIKEKDFMFINEKFVSRPESLLLLSGEGTFMS